MDLDPEVARKAADLKGEPDEGSEQTPANQERLHLDEKVDEMIEEAAANENSEEGSDR